MCAVCELMDQLMDQLIDRNRKKRENDMGTNEATAMAVKPEVKLTRDNCDIVREGKQIIVPSGMTLAEARVWLQRREEDEDREVAINEVVDAYPLEGAYAFSRALDELFGFAQFVETPGFLSNNPPAMIGLDVGPNKHARVPWGRVQIPAVDGFLQTGYTVQEGRLAFLIQGRVKQRNRSQVDDLVTMTKRLVKEESIYRGQAIRVEFPDLEDMGSPFDYAPKFIDTTRTEEAELVFSESVLRLVTNSILTPIRNTQACRTHRIPLKRGVLLAGPYGTGKTLTASIVAKACVENGWTFLYLEDTDDMAVAIRFAQQYQPAVIFAEDIDRVITGVRTMDMDEILNTIDGVDTKNNEIMVVLTTNHLEDINPALLRPGRLDTVINVDPPDSLAAQRLVKIYARGLLPQDEDLTRVGAKLAGQIPAVIREVVERSKLYAVGRGGTEALQIHATDLESASDEMRHHLSLLAVKPKDERSDVEKAGDAIGGAIVRAFSPAPKSPTNGASTKDVTARA